MAATGRSRPLAELEDIRECLFLSPLNDNEVLLTWRWNSLFNFYGFISVLLR